MPNIVEIIVRGNDLSGGAFDSVDIGIRRLAARLASLSDDADAAFGRLRGAARTGFGGASESADELTRSTDDAARSLDALGDTDALDRLGRSSDDAAARLTELGDNDAFDRLGAAANRLEQQSQDSRGSLQDLGNALNRLNESGLDRLGGAAEALRGETEDARRGVDELGDRVNRLDSSGFDRMRDASGRFRSATQENRREVDELSRRMGRLGADGDAELGRLGRGAGATGGHFGRMFNTLQSGAGRAGEALQQVGSRIAELGGDNPAANFAKIGAILTALPLLASTAATAIGVGLGAAIASIGIKAAAKAEEVKVAFSSLSDNVKASMTDMAKPFEATLLRISGVAQATFDALAPSLRAAFARMAPVVSEFAENFGRGVATLGPTIDMVSVKFEPLMERLGQRMPDLLSTLGESFSTLASKADPQFVDFLIDAINGLIRVSTAVIGTLADVGNGMADLWAKTKELGSWVSKLWGGGKDEGDEFAGALGNVTDKATNTATSIKALTASLNELAGKTLDSRAATRSFEAAIDAASLAVEKNGRTLDINTEKGRENQEALDSIAASAITMRDAMETNGQDSTLAMDRARAAFIRVARSMGNSADQAAALADQFGLVRVNVNSIPGSKTIRVRDIGTGEALRRAKDLDYTVRSIPAYREVVVNYLSMGDVIRNAQAMATGGIVGAAGGGPRSNMTLVGEQGPELVRLPFGSTVIPNGQTESMMAGGGGNSQRIVLELRGDGSAISNGLVEIIRLAVADRGGDVQLALGR